MEALEEKKQTGLWPYAIILVFVCFAVFIGQFVYRSIQNPTNLVDKNYYQNELDYQDVIDAKSKGLGVKNRMNVRLENKVLIIDFVEDWKDVSGQVYLYNPIGNEKDIKQAFSIKESQLKMKLRGLVNGVWVLKLGFNHEGEDYYLEEKLNVK